MKILLLIAILAYVSSERLGKEINAYSHFFPPKHRIVIAESPKHQSSNSNTKISLDSLKKENLRKKTTSKLRNFSKSSFSDCDSSAISVFQNIVGEEVVSAAGSSFQKEIDSCVNVQFPPEFMNVLRKCFFKVTGISMKPLTPNTEFHLPDRKLYQTFFNEFVECRLEALQIPYSKNFIDIHSYLDRHFHESWSGNRVDSAIITGIIGKCADDNMNGERPVTQQVFGTEVCIINEMISSCKLLGKESGLILLVLKSMFTLLEEPKCDGFLLPTKYSHNIFAFCLAEANDKWNTDGEHAYDGSILNPDIKDKIKNAFDFFRTWGKKILGHVVECSLKKADIYTEESGINYDKSIDIVSSFNWQDNLTKETILSAINDCRTNAGNSSGVEQMGGFLSEDFKGFSALITERFRFEKCFGPKFVETCGMNNEVASYFYPLLNNDFADMVIGDLKDKRGFVATSHMQAVFRDQFSIFLKNML